MEHLRSLFQRSEAVHQGVPQFTNFLVMQPWTQVQIAEQLDHQRGRLSHPFSSFRDTWKTIYQTEGWRGLFCAGLPLASAFSLQMLFLNKGKEGGMAQALLYSIPAALAAQPFFVTGYRMIAIGGDQYSTPIKAASTVYKEEGLTGFLRGFDVTLLFTIMPALSAILPLDTARANAFMPGNPPSAIALTVEWTRKREWRRLFAAWRIVTGALLPCSLAVVIVTACWSVLFSSLGITVATSGPAYAAGFKFGQKIREVSGN